MSTKETRRSRYQKTASALRHILHFGSLPDARAKYYDGYAPFEIWGDRFGLWIKLVRGDRYLAIVDYKTVRCVRNTVYLPILQAFAKRTNRRFIVADRFVPTSKFFEPKRYADSNFGNYEQTPFTVNRQGRVRRRQGGVNEYIESLSYNYRPAAYTTAASSSIDLSVLPF